MKVVYIWSFDTRSRAHRSGTELGGYKCYRKPTCLVCHQVPRSGLQWHWKQFRPPSKAEEGLKGGRGNREACPVTGPRSLAGNYPTTRRVVKVWMNPPPPPMSVTWQVAESSLVTDCVQEDRAEVTASKSWIGRLGCSRNDVLKNSVSWRGCPA